MLVWIGSSFRVIKEKTKNVYFIVETALLLHYVLTPKSLWVSDYGEVGLTRAFYCTELLGSPESNKKERRGKNW